MVTHLLNMFVRSKHIQKCEREATASFTVLREAAAVVVLLLVV